MISALLYIFLFTSAAAWPVYNETLAILYYQYALVSFCEEGVIQKWDCGPLCHQAHSIPNSTRFVFKGPVYGAKGYVALMQGGADDIADNRCMVAFRGTGGVRNALTDALVFGRWPPLSLQAWRTSWCPGCRVHSGYAAAYEEVREPMIRAFQQLRCKSLTFTGHSLGGGLATIAAMDMRGSKRILVESVWTYGKPRVGNAAFVHEFEKAAEMQGAEPPMWRIVHYHDIVPHLNPFGQHEPLTVYYKHDAYDSRDASRYEVCQRVVDDFCIGPCCTAGRTNLREALEQAYALSADPSASFHCQYLGVNFVNSVSARAGCHFNVENDMHDLVGLMLDLPRMLPLSLLFTFALSCLCIFACCRCCCLRKGCSRKQAYKGQRMPLRLVSEEGLSLCGVTAMRPSVPGT